METKEFVCVVCPKGCDIKVNVENGKVISVAGNTCRKGEEYGRTEAIYPTRTLTTTVRIANGNLTMLPVKSEKPLPKLLLMDCMKVINNCFLKAPISIGDIIVENILNTGINIIATSNVSEKLI